MSTITLEEIQNEAAEQYGDLNIPTDDQTLVLRNALRLPKGQRQELFAIFDKKEEAEGDAPEDIEDLFDQVLRLVASKDHAAKLVKFDAPTKAIIFKKYSEATQAGEASGSED